LTAEGWSLNPKGLMKNVSLILLFIFTLTFSAHSQISKGTWMLGGNLSLGSFSSKDFKADPILSQSANFSITPRVGWFIRENLVIGLSPSYSFSSQNTNSPAQDNRTSSFSFAPFIRTYKTLYEKWAIFADFNGISVNFASSKYEGDNIPIREASSQGYQLGIFVSPGVTYFITPKVGIEASLGSLGFGFSRTRTKEKITNSNEPFEKETVYNSSNGGLSMSSLIQNIALGIHIYLPGK